MIYDLAKIDREVMSDMHRPCLYGVSGPCFHPKCLYAHAETLIKFKDAQKATK